MIRRGVASMLASEGHMACVGDAGNREDAIRLAPGLSPHVVVFELSLGGADGLETMAALRPLLPRTRFVVLTGVTELGAVRRAVAAGAAGYVLKTASSTELVRAIEAAHRGEATFAREVSMAMSAGAKSDAAKLGMDLTQRERELLGLMARGLSNQDISVQLGIAMPTVKFHVTNILSKLRAENRTEAVLTALRQRLVSL
jgi:NarL family two-component system response regulator LiaR